jgi:hypothetical protein
MPTRQRSRPKPQEAAELKLDDAHAIAVLDKAVEYEVIDEDKVPDNKRQRLTAAAEQVDLLIEAWTTGGISPYSDDEEKAEMGKAIQDILDIAGVEIDEDGNVTYGDLPDLEDGGEADDDNEGGEDGEAAFDIEDIIEGYPELSAASRCKAIDKLELDMDDDDDYNTSVSIWEWENAQEKPSGRVMNYLEEMWPAEGEGEAPADDDEDAEAAGDGDGEESEGGWEQPWTKRDGAPADYDKMSAVDVKKYLDKMLAKDELSAELLQYVIDYETQREKPPTRKRILDHANKMMGDVEGEGDNEPEADEEPPARAGRPTAARRTRTRTSRDPDDQDDADDAVARDDERDARRAAAEGEEEEWDEEALLEYVPGGLATAFVNARLHDKALEIAGLGEPGEWDGEMPELPEDIATMDHDALSNLLADFAVCLSTAYWFATKARIERIFYDQIVEYMEAISVLESEESSEQKRKADAATQPAVVVAKALAATATSDMHRFQTMASNLKLKHATVSRVGGFVGDEVEAEEQEQAPRISSRGRAAGAERAAGGARRQRPRRR